ncbi:MAG: alpha/beta hydrolase, partial [Oscillospiraceae bacterium]|nr:alpha/beta hydrolase [Oscillospiraceae bacterium]
MSNQDTRTFTVYPQIEMRSVRFQNRYGIELAGDIYLPENCAGQKNPAIIVAGPFGAVKEQASGLYAQQFAAMGFVAMTFDPSFNGESGGKVRNMASPDIFTEDYSAAVDCIGLLDFVDRERIGVVGICGLSGMAITAAGTDTRIKAVATLSMYDMSRDMSRGYRDYYTEEQRMKIKQYLSEQRWRDAENGTYALGNHEIGFDELGNPLTAAM